MKCFHEIKFGWFLVGYLSCCLYCSVFKIFSKKKKKLNPAPDAALSHLFDAPNILKRQLDTIIPIWKICKPSFRKVIEGQSWGLTQSFGAFSPFLCPVLLVHPRLKQKQRPDWQCGLPVTPRLRCSVASTEQHPWRSDCLLPSGSVSTYNTNSALVDFYCSRRKLLVVNSHGILFYLNTKFH